MFVTGMFILRKLFEKYETPEKVLMAYNLGESGLPGYGKMEFLKLTIQKAFSSINKNSMKKLKGEKKND